MWVDLYVNRWLNSLECCGHTFYCLELSWGDSVVFISLLIAMPIIIMIIIDRVIIFVFAYYQFLYFLGTNLEDGPRIKVPYFTAITAAVEQGKLNESIVREAVKPLFYTRMRLGLFDPPKLNPYSHLNVSMYVQCKKHRELAVTSALKTFVLIKNDDNTLPIQRRSSGKPIKKLAVRNCDIC